MAKRKGSRKVDGVQHGHGRVHYTNPDIGESDTPSELTPTEKVGRSVNRLNILRTNRKRKK